MAATIVSLSASLLRQTLESWTREFHDRAWAGIKDEDFALLIEGSLRKGWLLDSTPSGFAVLGGRDVEGLVIFDAALHHSRIKDTAEVVYIRYLATAPWNRVTGNPIPRSRGIGRLLVEHAVRESIRRGSPGRIGVHALPASATFFENLAFERFGGSDSEHGMPYFELRPVVAVNLLMHQNPSGARLARAQRVSELAASPVDESSALFGRRSADVDGGANDLNQFGESQRDPITLTRRHDADPIQPSASRMVATLRRVENTP